MFVPLYKKNNMCLIFSPVYVYMCVFYMYVYACLCMRLCVYTRIHVYQLSHVPYLGNLKLWKVAPTLAAMHMALVGVTLTFIRFWSLYIFSAEFHFKCT